MNAIPLDAPHAAFDWTLAALALALVLLGVVTLCCALMASMVGERDRGVANALDALREHGARRDREMTALAAVVAELRRRQVDDADWWKRGEEQDNG